MGVGGALVMPATLSILVNAFPSGERAKAIGIWAGIAGGGGALGLVLGGWLRRALLVGLGVRHQRARHRHRARARRAALRADVQGPAPSQLDPAGAVLSMAGLGAVRLRPDRGAALGLESTHEPRRRSAPASPCWPSSCCGSCAPRTPMLDVRLFKDRRLRRSARSA